MIHRWAASAAAVNKAQLSKCDQSRPLGHFEASLVRNSESSPSTSPALLSAYAPATSVPPIDNSV